MGNAKLRQKVTRLCQIKIDTHAENRRRKKRLMMQRDTDKAFKIQHKELKRSARVMTKRAAAQLFLYKTSRRVTLAFFREDIRHFRQGTSCSLFLSFYGDVDVRAQPQTLSSAELQLEHTVMLRPVCLHSTAHTIIYTQTYGRGGHMRTREPDSYF